MMHSKLLFILPRRLKARFNYNLRNYTTKQQGFSLIELLIAIAIVAILGAISQPIYSDYVVRATMSEPIQIADSLGARIVQCMVLDGSDFEGCNSFTELNIVEADFIANTIESIDFGTNEAPSFTVNLQNTGNSELDEATLNYQVENAASLLLRWKCALSDTTLHNLVSRQCRN